MNLIRNSIIAITFSLSACGEAVPAFEDPSKAPTPITNPQLSVSEEELILRLSMLDICHKLDQGLKENVIFRQIIITNLIRTEVATTPETAIQAATDLCAKIS